MVCHWFELVIVTLTFKILSGFSYHTGRYDRYFNFLLYPQTKYTGFRSIAPPPL